MVTLDNKNVFAANLNHYMEINDKSRKEVAEAIGVSYFTFTSWITGQKYPRMDKVEKLANYFGILKSDLIEEKVTDEAQEKNDTAVGIVVRLGKDKDFCDLVKLLYKLDDKQLASVKNLISSFIQ